MPVDTIVTLCFTIILILILLVFGISTFIKLRYSEDRLDAMSRSYDEALVRHSNTIVRHSNDLFSRDKTLYLTNEKVERLKEELAFVNSECRKLQDELQKMSYRRNKK